MQDWPSRTEIYIRTVSSCSPLIFKIQSKRHRKDINFRWLFLVFFVRNLKTQGKVIKSWCLFGQKPKNTRKSHRKLMSFRHLFGLNFEDEGAKFLWSSNQCIISVFGHNLNWVFWTIGIIYKFLKMETQIFRFFKFMPLLSVRSPLNSNAKTEWYLAFENDAQGLRVLGHFHAAWGIHVKVRNSWIRYSVRHLASKSDVAWSLQIFVQNL